MHRLVTAGALALASLALFAGSAEARDGSPCGAAHKVSFSARPAQTCPLGNPLPPKGWVPVYRSPVAHAKGAKVPSPAGWLHGTSGQSFICQQSFASAEYYHPKGFRNRWWAYTKSDDGVWGWVPEVFFSGGNNDEGDAGLTSCGTTGPNPTVPQPSPPVSTPSPKHHKKKHKKSKTKKKAKAKTAACTSYTVFGVRGSGEGYSGPYDMGATVGSTAQYTAAKLRGRSVRFFSIPYPAAPVSDLVKSGGTAFFRSMDYGEILLKNEITKTVRNCPHSKIGVIGYSQGAGVTSNVLRDVPTSYFKHIRGAILYADTYSQGQNKWSLNFDYFDPNRTTPYKRKGHGIFGARKLPKALPAALDICFGNDIVCDSSKSTRDQVFQAFVADEHTHYKDWSPGFAPSIPSFTGVILGRMLEK